MSTAAAPYVSHPTPSQPLAGLSVLVVEDSRFASEAVRLLCIRSGARIRRADSLAAAWRHLAVYRPSVVIVDMGLPDGNGAELIAELARARPRVQALIAMSGDPETEDAALAAGADRFLAKPLESLALFQQAVLASLPAGSVGLGPRVLPAEVIAPDSVALADDLLHVADLLHSDGGARLDYLAQFLGTIGRSAHDSALEAAAHSLARSRASGRQTRMDVARVAGLVQERLQAARAV